MKRRITVALLAGLMLFGTLVVAQPAVAQGGCKTFGEETAGFATLLGRGFGEATAANPDVSGFVHGQQASNCG